MKKFMPLLASSLLFNTFIATAQEQQTETKKWQTPVPIFKQDFDWLRLTSDEWLKGDIIALYDGTLEFDSDEMGMQSFDWEDIAELRSKEIQSIRLEGNQIIEGTLVVKDGQLYIDQNGIATEYDYSQLLSIASSEANERDLWDGDVSIGANFSSGNTEQLDYTFTAEVQRRTSTSRFNTHYTLNYSENKDQDTGITKSTADSQRLTSFYDWFFSQRLFLRAADFEFYSDAFKSIDSRTTFGVSMGYTMIDTSKVNWDITVGPSYQKTAFINAASDDDSETSSVLSIGTQYEYEINSDIDFDFNYQVQVVSEEAGEHIHHVETGLDMDLINDFELEITGYFDRTELPYTDADDNTPEKNDYRLVIGLSYEF